MQVHLFKGQGRVFGAVPGDFAGRLPTKYGPWVRFKILDLARGEVQPGLNVDACLDDIDRYGFHLTDAHVRITEQSIE